MSKRTKVKATDTKKAGRVGMRPKEGTPGKARKRVMHVSGSGKRRMRDA